MAALWKSPTGEAQDIHVDVRKALRSFVVLRSTGKNAQRLQPMLLPRDTQFSGYRASENTRGRHVVALNIYPGLRPCAQLPEVQ